VANVVFTNSTSGNPDSYYWDFGDGTNTGSANIANPTHTYVASGVYVVRLTATKAGVGSIIAKAVPIQAGSVGFTLMANNESAVLSQTSGNLLAAVV